MPSHSLGIHHPHRKDKLSGDESFQSSMHEIEFCATMDKLYDFLKKKIGVYFCARMLQNYSSQLLYTISIETSGNVINMMLQPHIKQPLPEC